MILHSDREGNDCIQKLRCHCIQIMHSDIYSVAFPWKFDNPYCHSLPFKKKKDERRKKTKQILWEYEKSRDHNRSKRFQLQVIQKFSLEIKNWFLVQSKVTLTRKKISGSNLFLTFRRTGMSKNLTFKVWSEFFPIWSTFNIMKRQYIKQSVFFGKDVFRI